MSGAYTTDRGLVPRTREAIKYAYPLHYICDMSGAQEPHNSNTYGEHTSTRSLSCRPARTNGSPRSLHSRARQTTLLAKAAHSRPTTAHQTTKICRVPPLTRNDASRASVTLLEGRRRELVSCVAAAAEPTYKPSQKRKPAGDATARHQKAIVGSLPPVLMDKTSKRQWRQEPPVAVAFLQP